MPSSPSPAVVSRLKDELSSSYSASEASSTSRLSQRLSGTSFSVPQSPSSFVNPLHNPFRSPRTSQIILPSSPTPTPPQTIIIVDPPNTPDGNKFTQSGKSHSSLMDDQPDLTSPTNPLTPTTLSKTASGKRSIDVAPLLLSEAFTVFFLQ